MELIPPDPTTTSQYGETQIVDLLSQFYRTLEHFGYLHDNDNDDEEPTIAINWPPSEGRTLDFSECGDAAIDERVVSLMKRIPTMPDNYVGVAPLLSGMTFIEATDLARSREVMLAGEWYSVPPHMLQLFGGQDAQGAVLLDVTDSMATYMIRIMDDSAPLNIDTDNRLGDFDERAYPPGLDNWPKEDAPTFLRKMNQKILVLDWYPSLGASMVEPVDERLPYTVELRRVLKEEYHWPGNDFRRDDWMRDGERRMKEIGFPQ